MNEKRVLVTGGAGYNGSILVRQLLQNGYRVRVVDSLMFGGKSLIEVYGDPRFEFIRGDLCTSGVVGRSVENCWAVVHLAAIVGDPACRDQPGLAKKVNLEVSKKILTASKRKGVERFVFASTCSNYGKMWHKDAFVNEASALTPISLYAKTKVAFEKHLFQSCRKHSMAATCLRFATAYGKSPRLRFDLTVNEFTRDLACGKTLLIFGEQFWRPYCHVHDLARGVICVLKNRKSRVKGEVFNVGDTRENYTKKMIVDELLSFFPKARVQYVTRKEDPRDYRVDFSKIRDQLGFRISMRVRDGIKELKDLIESGLIEDPYCACYNNARPTPRPGCATF